jgi:GNAT superfamily N-acetyltransferase
MELPPGVHLSFEERPSPQDREFVNEALGEFNTAFLHDPIYASFGIFARDASRGIQAGLVGQVYADWLFIALLWVHERLRRGGVGRALMTEAEHRARGYGCHSAWVDTFSFQAPGFYQKLGYREFGRIDYPPDHQRIFLRKQLSTG